MTHHRAIRYEPTMGDLSSISQDNHASLVRQYEKQSLFSYGLWVALILFVLLLSILWFFQNDIRSWFPDTEENQKVLLAKAAFQSGNLVGEDGTSALDIYQQILQDDPENPDAWSGMVKIQEQLIANIQKSIAQSDVQTAKEQLHGLQKILQGGIEFQNLEQAIQQLEQKNNSVENLLKQALSAFNQGNWLEEQQGAAILFQQVLNIDAHNGLAQKGLRDIAIDLAQQTRAAITKNQLPQAAKILQNLKTIYPNYDEITVLSAEYFTAYNQQQKNIMNWLSKADKQMRQGELITPADHNAMLTFKQILAIDPDHSEARAGLTKVGTSLLVQASALIEAHDFVTAEKLLKQAKVLHAPYADLLAVQGLLREARERHDIANQRTVLTSAQITKIQKLLQVAEQALLNDHLVAPPGANAYDAYHTVQMMEPNNRDAKQGLTKVAQRARVLFDEALHQRQLSRAHSYLNIYMQIRYEAQVRQDMAQRLMHAYLIQINQNITNRQYVLARQMWKQAASLMPTDSRLAVIDTQLQELGV